MYIGTRDLAIDVGTGTGQAAVPLTKYFKDVIGTDPSAGQLANTSIGWLRGIVGVE